jgi:hypothetical protein
MSILSEEIMGVEFEKILSRNKQMKLLPPFDTVFKEVPSVQGVPDYVGVRFLKDSINDRRLPHIERSYLSSASTILPLLKYNAPRTLDYIILRTGLSRKIVKSTLTYLIQKSIVTDSVDKYLLSPSFNIPNIEIWAFELKLKDWKRALFQALRYKAFANYSIIVLPMNKRKVILENSDLIRNLNIGVLLFDPITGQSDLVIKTKKANPSSKVYTLYMQGQLLDKFKNSQRIKLPK